jgi:hypothetical protein
MPLSQSGKALVVWKEKDWLYQLWRIEGGDRKGGGGGERELNQILLQEPTCVLNLTLKAKTLQEGDEHTNQQCRNDPLKVVNAVKK